jgi:hypothetical protein
LLGSASLLFDGIDLSLGKLTLELVQLSLANCGVDVDAELT